MLISSVVRAAVVGSFCCLFLPQLAHAQQADLGRRYVQVTQLKLRAAPAADAPVLAQWRINQAVEVLRRADKRWCELALPDGSQRGFADCSFLGEQALSLEKIEIEVMQAALAINRLLVGRDSLGVSGWRYEKNPPELRQGLEKILNLLERHFAISPSLYTYGDYNDLLTSMLNSVSEETKDQELKAIRQLAEARIGQLGLMRAQLTQNYAQLAATPVRHPINHRLNLLLTQRRHGDPAGPGKKPDLPDFSELLKAGETGPAQGLSFFRKDVWAVGFAGGGMVSRMRGRAGQGAAYALRFDAQGPWALADVYEMAKAQGLAVKAQFAPIKLRDGEAGLAYTLPTAGRGRESLQLELSLPVWAVTEQGLFEGRLRKVSFGGDACSGDSGVPTAAEVVFPVPVKGAIQAVFATNGKVNPAQAVISLRQKISLEPLRHQFENTLTRRVDTRVDIDGDGVTDLRTVISIDQDAALSPADGFRLARHKGQAGDFRKVAGWYANDVYQLQANVDGWWQTLSRYNLQTCT